MTETITLEPNYPALYSRFKDCAKYSLLSLARKDTLTAKEVYDFISTFRIALASATKEEQIVELRELIAEGAELMFATMKKEENEEDANA